MNQRTKVNDEYESQLFSFSCREFSMQVELAIMESLDSVFSTMERALVRHGVAKGIDISVKERLENLSCVYKQAAAKHMRILSLQLKEHYFGIPPHVLLKGDEVHRTQHTKEDLRRVEKEVNQMTQELKRLKILQDLLQAEISEGSAFISRLELIPSVVNHSEANKKVHLKKLNLYAIQQDIAEVEIVSGDLILEQPASGQDVWDPEDIALFAYGI